MGQSPNKLGYSQIIKSARIVRRLYDQVHSGFSAWGLFLESNGPLDNEEGRAPLRNLLRNTKEGHGFGWVQDYCVDHTKLVICRATDQPNGSRATLYQLEKDFSQSQVIEYMHELCLRRCGRYGLSSAESIADGVRKNAASFLNDLEKFRSAGHIESVRSIRHGLAHNLIGQPARQPILFHIHEALHQVASLIRLARCVVTGVDFSPEQLARVNQRYSKRFWDTFELGLQARRNGS